jgi:hypothetical protein
LFSLSLSFIRSFLLYTLFKSKSKSFHLIDINSIPFLVYIFPCPFHFIYLRFLKHHSISYFFELRANFSSCFSYKILSHPSSAFFLSWKKSLFFKKILTIFLWLLIKSSQR